MSNARRCSASVEEVKKHLNSAFGKLYRINADGEYVPYICLICDVFLKAQNYSTVKLDQLQKCRSILRPGNSNGVDPYSELAEFYTYSGDSGDDADEEDRLWLKDLMLSPEGCYIRPTGHSNSEGFVVCHSCKYGVDRVQMPKFAIANNYCFGAPPACLTDLNEVELALLTPVKTFGYCFTYVGGKKKQLKGSLSFFKVKMLSIARTVAQFDVLGLNKDIVVILYGKMTPAQRRKAREKNKVRPRQLLIAVEWLLLNNEEWRGRNISMENLRQELRNPTLIDHSKEVEGDNSASNVENTETFEVYFPDGTMSAMTGGQENIERFQELIQEVQRSGYNLELRNHFAKEAVHDFKDNNLVNACLLQFPYGRGGLHEIRLKGDGSITQSTNIEEYIEHLSRVSLPHFHEELFSLILYNMFMKQQMVKSAALKVRSNRKASTMAKELTQEDVEEAMSARANGRSGVSTTGREFLRSVDAVARAVPHSTEAAKSARRDGEAHQHRFGLPSIFLTVAPDDDNSFFVQVLLGVIVDDDEDVGMISDEELAARAEKRTTLRIRYPGVCSFFFEQVLDIVIRDVIGWNIDEQRPTDVPGLFGIPEALAAAVEEQGRATLHGHILVWIPQFNIWRDDLYSPSDSDRRFAKRKLEETMEAVSSTMLFHGDYRSFPHRCTEEYESVRRKPVVVDDQQLRNLRHRIGQNQNGKMFAYCPDCTMSWTNEEFVESYLIHR